MKYKYKEIGKVKLEENLPKTATNILKKKMQ